MIATLGRASLPVIRLIRARLEAESRYRNTDWSSVIGTGISDRALTAGSMACAEPLSMFA